MSLSNPGFCPINPDDEMSSLGMAPRHVMISEELRRDENAMSDVVYMRHECRNCGAEEYSVTTMDHSLGFELEMLDDRYNIERIDL